MAGNIRINPEEVKAAAKQIADHAVSYNREIQQIYSTVDELRKAWQGSAAERFIRDIDSFRREFEDFGTKLNGFSEVLKSTAADYQRLEDGDI